MFVFVSVALNDCRSGKEILLAARVSDADSERWRVIVGCGWIGSVRDAWTPLSPLLSVHLVQEGGGVSGDGHGRALDHGAG